jgi:hypothetical protein
MTPGIGVVADGTPQSGWGARSNNRGGEPTQPWVVVQFELSSPCTGHGTVQYSKHGK